MSVPAFVPRKVPAKLKRKAEPKPRYLTGGPSGWRFQMRLPTEIFEQDFGLAGSPSVLRAQLGPRSRGEAKRLSLTLASLCQSIFSAALEARKSRVMSIFSMNDPETNLAAQVVQACQSAIDRALAEPSQAIGLALGLSSALQTLQLVQGEVSKGPSGAPAIVANADMLARGALAEVLRLSAQPNNATAALAAVANVAPPAPVAPEARRASAKAKPLPYFSEVSDAYILTRIERDGEDHPDIPSLRLRRQTFFGCHRRQAR